MPAAVWAHLGHRVALLGLQERRDLLQRRRPKLGHLSEQSRDLRRLVLDVASVQRQLAELGLRLVKRLPELLLLVGVARVHRADGAHLVIGEPEFFLEPFVRGWLGRRTVGGTLRRRICRRQRECRGDGKDDEPRGPHPMHSVSPSAGLPWTPGASWFPPTS